MLAPICLQAAGSARIEAAIASKVRREADAAKLSAENAVLRDRIAHTVARTDDDITDEAAGFARTEVAAASSARKQEEAAKLAAENRAMRDRIKSVQAVTDDDITDDIAADGTVGAGRSNAAAASKARKLAEAEMLAQQNASLRQRIANSTAAVVDELS